MIALNAHFDGKVIVPDEPLDLPANQRIRISIEPIEAEPTPKRVNFRDLIGLGLQGPTNPNQRFPDDDSLWEGSIGDTLVNDPRKKKQP